MPRPAHDVHVAFAGDRRALAARTVRHIVEHVLTEEQSGAAEVTVTFMSTANMRRLNRQTFGRDRTTDVIAFGMTHDDSLIGDVYVCPAVARRSAREYGTVPRTELVRLVVHGTLHALGYDHPEGTDRIQSPMWKRQERYVARLLEAAR